MAAVEGLHRLAQTLAHGFRRARDDVTLLEEVLPCKALAPESGAAADLAKQPRTNRADGAIAGGVGETAIDVQAAVIEAVHVRRVIALGLLVGLGDRHALRAAEAVRIERLALLGHHVPVAVRPLFAPPVAEKRQDAVLMAVVGAEVPRLD